MDDRNAFERLLAQELEHRAGPVLPVDDAAIAEAVMATSDTPFWRLPSMFDALKLVAASLVLAVTGTFLFAVFTSDPEPDPGPATESASPTAIISGTVLVDQVPHPQRESRLVVELIDLSADTDASPIARYEHVEPMVSGMPREITAFDFALEYPTAAIDEDGSYVLRARGELTENGAVFAESASDVLVLTQGHPTDGVSIAQVPVRMLVPQLDSTVMAHHELPELEGPARLTLRLIAADAAGDPTIIAEAVPEELQRLRPPRKFTLEYDSDSIDPALTFRLEGRLTDAASSTVLATGDVLVPVLEDGYLVASPTLSLRAPKVDATDS